MTTTTPGLPDPLLVQGDWNAPASGARLALAVEMGRKAEAYDDLIDRLRHMHARYARKREAWANNTEQPCSTARAVAYQQAMQDVNNLIRAAERMVSGG